MTAFVAMAIYAMFFVVLYIAADTPAQYAFTTFFMIFFLFVLLFPLPLFQIIWLFVFVALFIWLFPILWVISWITQGFKWCGSYQPVQQNELEDNHNDNNQPVQQPLPEPVNINNNNNQPLNNIEIEDHIADLRRLFNDLMAEADEINVNRENNRFANAPQFGTVKVVNGMVNGWKRKWTSTDIQVNPSCCVWLEEFIIDEEIVALHCTDEQNHTFHPLCINDWAKKNRTCPLCRTDLVQLARKELNEGKIPEELFDEEYKIEQAPNNVAISNQPFPVIGDAGNIPDPEESKLGEENEVEAIRDLYNINVFDYEHRDDMANYNADQNHDEEDDSNQNDIEANQNIVQERYLPINDYETQNAINELNRINI